MHDLNATLHALAPHPTARHHRANPSPRRARRARQMLRRTLPQPVGPLEVEPAVIPPR